MLEVNRLILTKQPPRTQRCKNDAFIKLRLPLFAVSLKTAADPRVEIRSACSGKKKGRFLNGLTSPKDEFSWSCRRGWQWRAPKYHPNRLIRPFLRRRKKLWWLSSFIASACRLMIVLAPFQLTVSRLTRSSLHHCLQQHSIS